MVSAPLPRAESLEMKAMNLMLQSMAKNLCLADNVVELFVRRIAVDQTWTLSLCL